MSISTNGGAIAPGNDLELTSAVTSSQEKKENSDDRNVEVSLENNGFYVGVFTWLAIFSIVAIWNLNQKYAPVLYEHAFIEDVADAFAEGQNYAVFDLNIDTRILRDTHIAVLPETPDVAVLGASHWQEAPEWVVTHKDLYNSHVHRDYYEDMLSVVDMFERHGKLPRQLIITLRDRLFTPVSERTDALWYQTIPYYRSMAARLGLEQHTIYEVLPVDTWRERLSLSNLATNIARHHRAPELPHATDQMQFETLDVLLPGGSIIWSDEHRAIFTQERAVHEAQSFAEASMNNPPLLDREGIIAIDRLLDHLSHQGVEVFLAHPPFNPVFWDAVQGTPYMDGLERLMALARAFAEKYDLEIVGSFNPYDLGCTRYMFIDAEHSGAECIGQVLRQYAEIDQKNTTLSDFDTHEAHSLNVPGKVSDPYSIDAGGAN